MPSKLDFDPYNSGTNSGGLDFDPYSEPTQATPAAPAIARPDRSWVQAATDTYKGVATGVGNVISGAGTLYGLATGDMDNAATRFGGSVRDYWQERQSDALKADKAARSAAIDQADGILGKAGTAIKETIKNPSLLADTVAENIATFIPAAGAARVGSIASKAAGATAATAARVGTGAGIGVGAVQQGADVAQGAYDAAIAKPDAVWNTNAEYAKRVAAGESQDAVKHSMALESARIAMPAAAAVSVATQFLPGASMAERFAAGATAKAAKVGGKEVGGLAGRAVNAAKGVAGEGAQEALEEGGGQFAANLTNRNIDQNQSLSEGVGESAGMGFVGGAGLGGIAGAAQRPRVIDDVLKQEGVQKPVQPPSQNAGTSGASTDTSEQPSGVAEPLGGDIPVAGSATVAQPATLLDGSPVPDPSAGPLSRSVNVGVESGAVPVADPFDMTDFGATTSTGMPPDGFERLGMVAQGLGLDPEAIVAAARADMGDDTTLDTLDDRILATYAQSLGAANGPAQEVAGPVPEQPGLAAVQGTGDAVALPSAGQDQAGVGAVEAAGQPAEATGREIARADDAGGAQAQGVDAGFEDWAAEQRATVDAANAEKQARKQRLPALEQRIAENTENLKHRMSPATRKQLQQQIENDRFDAKLAASDAPASYDDFDITPERYARVQKMQSEISATPKPEGWVAQQADDGRFEVLDASGKLVGVERAPDADAAIRTAAYFKQPATAAQAPQGSASQVSAEGQSVVAPGSATPAEVDAPAPNPTSPASPLAQATTQESAASVPSPQGTPVEGGGQGALGKVGKAVLSAYQKHHRKRFPDFDIHPRNGEDFARAVESKDVAQISRVLTNDSNVSSRRAFELTTGITMPERAADIPAAIAAWAATPAAPAPQAQPAPVPQAEATPEPQANTGGQGGEAGVKDSFIRKLTPAERASQREKNRGWNAIPKDPDGREVVFKPRGEQGPGFYYAATTPEAIQKKADEVMEVVREGGLNLTRDQVVSLIEQKGIAAADKTIEGFRESRAKQAADIAKYEAAKEKIKKPRSKMTAKELREAEKAKPSAPSQQTEPVAQKAGVKPDDSATYQQQADPKKVAAPSADRGEGKKEAKPDPTDTKTNTEDAGEELWANRRNSTGKGLQWADIEGLNPTLKAREATKTKVWPRPNYEQLIEGGIPAPMARIIKSVYDAIATKPKTSKAPTDADYQAYIAGVQKVRDAAFAWARAAMEKAPAADNKDVVEFGEQHGLAAKDVAALVGVMLKRGGDGSMLDAVFPYDAQTERNRFRSGTPRTNANNDLALLLGGRKLTGAMQVIPQDIMAAIRDVQKGWPSPQEAWEKTYTIHEDKVGERKYRNGQTVTITEPNFWIATKSGRFNLIVADGFKTREGAASEAKALYEKNRKTTWKGPAKEAEVALSDTRDGPARRQSNEDITSDKLMETFGFKGVNFGNWMKGETKAKLAERQAHLNNAYDSLADLAEILGIPPKAIGLNGMLGLAIGAQGHGGKAAAHFVPGVNEINLTRKQGAGSLAHEWAHALDHYFATLAGNKLATSATPFLTEHTDKTHDGVRAEVQSAFKAIVKAMRGRDMTPEEVAAQERSMVDAARKTLDRMLRNMRSSLESMKLKTTQPREQVLAGFDDLAERLRRGDIGEGYLKHGKGQTDFEPQVVALLAMHYREALGYKFGETGALGYSARRVAQAGGSRESSATHVPQVPSNYRKEALKLDKGTPKYWATNLEMFARAFQSYVLDKLAAQGARNDYLTRPQDDEEVLRVAEEMGLGEGGDRYPRQSERAAINAAFDTLVGAVRTRETDTGIALESVEGLTVEEDAQPTDAEAAAFDRQSIDRKGLQGELNRQQGQRDAEASGLADKMGVLLAGANIEVVYARDENGLEGLVVPGYMAKLRDQQQGRGPDMFTAALYITPEMSKDGKPFAVVFTGNRLTVGEKAFSGSHEVAGHHGIRAFLGDRLNPVLRLAYQNPTVKAVADNMFRTRKYAKRVASGERTQDEMFLLSIEEALADLAAANRTGNWQRITDKHGVEVPKAMRSKLHAMIQNVVQRIKDLFRRKDVRFSDAQVISLLENAWQAAQGNQASMSVIGPDGALEQVVFHGTPHTVDRFSLQKIGTGEGAQAYGYGAYFASRRDVADHYRESLSGRARGGLSLAGVVPASRNEGLSDAAWVSAEKLSKLLVSDAGVVKPFGDLDVKGQASVLSVVRDLIQDDKVLDAVVRLIPVEVVNVLGGKERPADYLLHHPTMLVYLLPADAKNLVPGGVEAMNVLAPAVALAAAKVHTGLARFDVSPSDFLTASGALVHDVPPTVAGKIPQPSEFRKGNLYRVDVPEDSDLLDWDKPLSEQPEKVQEALKPVRALGGFGVVKASVIYTELQKPYQAEKLGIDLGSNPQKAVSEYLNSLGIPGLRYLDGNSRANGEGSANYVIWDESAIGTPESALESTEDQTQDNPSILESVEGFELSDNPTAADVRIPGEINLSALHKGGFKAAMERIGQKFTSLKPKVLALIPLQELDDFSPKRVDKDGKAESLTPAVGQYIKLQNDMQAFRNGLYVEYDKVAQDLQAFASEGTGFRGWMGNRVSQQGRDLFALMHDSTVAGVDPSEVGTRFKEPEKAAKYRELQERYNALPEKGRELFKATRDAYAKQTDLLDEVLEGNVKRTAEITINRARRRLEAREKEIDEDSGMSAAEKKKARDAARAAYDDTVKEGNVQSKMAALRAMLEKNRVPRPYFPLKRNGEFWVSVLKDGKLAGFSKFQNAEEQQAYSKEMIARGFETRLKYERDGSAKTSAMIDPTFVAEVEGILAGLPNEIRDEVWQAYLERMPDMSLRKSFIHRKNVPGYHFDALKAFGSSMFHSSYQLSRLKYGVEMQEALDVLGEQANDLRGKDDTAALSADMIRGELKERHAFIMNPTNARWAQTVTGAAFIYSLGANPAHLFLNATQTIMLGLPVMGSRYGFNRATAAIGKAAKDFSKGKGHVDKANLTDDERRAFKEMQASGIIEKSQAHDMAGIGAEGVEYSAIRKKVMDKVGWFMHQSERFNREVTAMAGYRLARAEGKTHEAAVAAAEKMVYTIHFDYSNSGRARIMQGDLAKALLVFRNYQANMLYRLFRDIHQSIRGESVQVKREARRQLGAIFGMYAFFAGTMGVPFYGLAMALAGLGDDDDDPVTAEQQFVNGTVEFLGPTAASILLRGLPGTLFDIDLTERVGMGNLWFRSPNQEMEGRDAYYYWMEQLLGAGLAPLKGFFDGVNLARQGQFQRGLERMAPAALRNPLQAIRQAQEGGVTSLDGDLIKETTGGDYIAKALGFQPLSVSEQYDKNSNLKNADRRLSNRREKLLNRYFLAIQMGDDTAEVMADVQAFNLKNPEYAITRDTFKRSARLRNRNKLQSENGIVMTRRMRRLQERMSSGEEAADE